MSERKAKQKKKIRDRRLIQIPIIFVLGMLVGGFVTGVVGSHTLSNGEQVAVQRAPEQNSAAAAKSPALDADLIGRLNSSFVKIAETASPGVVTIFSDRIVETRHPFSGDLFREFFGDDFGRFFSPRNPDGGERRLRGMGSGVIVNNDGYILTNYHVVREADRIRVMLYGGKKVDGKIIGTDAKTDLAVIKIEEDGLEPLEFGDSDELRVGEWVVAIGSPLSENLARTVTAGIVSAKGRSNVGLADYEDFIQTDAAINPGNSGGALINLHGELVGINTAIATQSGGFQGIGFAVPINMASKVMDALIEEGKVVRGWLGVYIQDIDSNLTKALGLPSQDGALVSSVSEGSPADAAGIESGDVILAIDGQEVRNVTQLRNEVASRSPGSTPELKVWRDGDERTITVELGELPEEQASPEMRKSSLDKIGFSVQTLDDQLAQRLGYDTSEEGVVVTRINQASTAYRAGLREGDLIKKVNRRPVATAGQFSEIIGKLSPGDNVLVYAKRGQNSFFAAFELQ